MPKITKAAATRHIAIEARPDSVRAASDEIRARHGLPPVPETRYMKACRALVEPDPLKLAKDLAKRRAAALRKQAALDAEIATVAMLARSTRGASVTAVAETLGLSRQRLYQLAA